MLPLVKKFIFKLKRVFLHKSLNNVSDEMLKMINDKSYFRNSTEKGNKVLFNFWINSSKFIERFLIYDSYLFFFFPLLEYGNSSIIPF